MQPLIRGDSPGHYLLPLPPGLHPSDPQLLGFFTYEFRIGHATQWSTAQGRFGNPLRVAGIQHPPPTLTCSVLRYKSGIAASAAYANPVFDGASLRPFIPQTGMWILLYTQVYRADRSGQQNVLLGSRLAEPQRAKLNLEASGGSTDFFGTATWSQFEIASLLSAVGVGSDAPLSVLAVEILSGTQPAADPLGAQLGTERILRTSPLVPVSSICTEE